MRNIEILKERAENMRRKPTFYEAKFKERLELFDLDYKTQWVIGNYIVDFIVGNKIIEIDGSSHFEPEQAQYDIERTSYLEGLGYSVIRVINENVIFFDLNKLKENIKKEKSIICTRPELINYEVERLIEVYNSKGMPFFNKKIKNIKYYKMEILRRLQYKGFDVFYT